MGVFRRWTRQATFQALKQDCMHLLTAHLLSVPALLAVFHYTNTTASLPACILRWLWAHKAASTASHDPRWPWPLQSRCSGSFCWLCHDSVAEFLHTADGCTILVRLYLGSKP